MNTQRETVETKENISYGPVKVELQPASQWSADYEEPIKQQTMDGDNTIYEQIS